MLLRFCNLILNSISIRFLSKNYDLNFYTVCSPSLSKKNMRNFYNYVTVCDSPALAIEFDEFLSDIYLQIVYNFINQWPQLSVCCQSTRAAFNPSMGVFSVSKRANLVAGKLWGVLKSKKKLWFRFRAILTIFDLIRRNNTRCWHVKWHGWIQMRKNEVQDGGRRPSWNMLNMQ